MNWLDLSAGLASLNAVLAPLSAPLASPQAGLAALFLYSLLAATLLPGGSELALLALVWQQPEAWLPAWAVATLGNTLGGLISWACGRWLPRWQRLAALPQQARVSRYGPAILLLAWLPLLGDALCVAAGWLRLDWRACAAWMALGKGLRYAVLLWPVVG